MCNSLLVSGSTFIFHHTYPLGTFSAKGKTYLNFKILFLKSNFRTKIFQSCELLKLYRSYIKYKNNTLRNTLLKTVVK